MLFASLTISNINQPALAYVARYYKQGKAKSKEELYVSNLDGGHRRLLTTSGDVREVHWLDHNRLIWSSYAGEATEYWTSRLNPWRPQRTDASKNERLFAESRQAIVPPQAEEHKLVEIGERAPDIELTSPDDKLPTSPFQTVKLRYEKTNVIIDSQLLHIWKTQNQSRLWILSGDRPTGFHEIDSLHLWQRGKAPQQIFTYAGQYDFREDRDIFAYRTPFTTRPLKDGRRVWVTNLHVGNWRTKTDKTIIEGLVLVTNVSIQPPK